MKEKILIILRWIILLPASIIGSFLVYRIFFWLNKSSDYMHTNLDSIWDYIMMFVSHALMGAAFIWIGLYIAPKYKKICACVLFCIVCMFAGVALFSNIYVGFSWVSLVSMICMLAGAGFVFYLGMTDGLEID